MSRKRSKKKKPITEKQRAEDEKLRELLRHADLKKFESVLEKAVQPAKHERGG